MQFNRCRFKTYRYSNNGQAQSNLMHSTAHLPYTMVRQRPWIEWRH